MKNSKIVDLGMVRDALAEVDKLRSALISGKVTGFHAALEHPDGTQTVYLGGVYRNKPEAALKAAMRASAARMMAADDPPSLRAAV